MTIDQMFEFIGDRLNIIETWDKGEYRVTLYPLIGNGVRLKGTITEDKNGKLKLIKPDLRDGTVFKGKKLKDALYKAVEYLKIWNSTK